MIQANELMIGDLVYNSNSNFNNIYRVGQIRLDYICGHKFPVLDWSDEEDIPYEEIRGIPLTEEWLLRLGFKECDTSPYKNKKAWIIGDDRNALIFSGSDIFMKLPDGFLCISKKPVEYAHQFQNIYFALIA